MNNSILLNWPKSEALEACRDFFQQPDVVRETSNAAP
jgi:hypothetical protein